MCQTCKMTVGISGFLPVYLHIVYTYNQNILKKNKLDTLSEKSRQPENNIKGTRCTESTLHLSEETESQGICKACLRYTVLTQNWRSHALSTSKKHKSQPYLPTLNYDQKVRARYVGFKGYCRCFIWRQLILAYRWETKAAGFFFLIVRINIYLQPLSQHDCGWFDQEWFPQVDIFQYLVIKQLHYLRRIGCGLVRRIVLLRMGFTVSKPQVMPSVFLFFLPANLNIGLSATSPETSLPMLTSMITE